MNVLLLGLFDKLKIYIMKEKFYKIYFSEMPKLSPNVLGIRRSSPPYKALRSKAVGWNVGERKHHKGRSLTGVFRTPSRRTGGAAYTVC